MNIQVIHNRMSKIACDSGLNGLYANDLIDDLRYLKLFNGCDFVWLLRTNGTNIVPLEIGVDDSHITHWLWETPSQVKSIYHISLDNETMEKIDFDKAERLVNLQPAQFTSLASKETIATTINKVIAYGCEMRIWGAFTCPSSPESIGNWNDWLNYFRSTGNRVMISFMANAIRKFNQ